MPHFRYRVRDAEGRAVQGRIEALSAESAADQLSANGALPLHIEETAGPSGRGRALKRRLGLGRPELNDVLLFARQAYALTKAGVPITRGLSQLAASTRNEVLSEAIQAMVEDLEAGRDLGGAMARHPRVFSPLFVAMIRVGEESGRLDEAFLRMTHYLDNERTTTNQIKSALRYPAFVVASLVIAVFILMWKVIPVFAGVYENFDLELPLPTRLLIATSGFVSAYWWLILFGAAGAVYGARRFVATERGRLLWDEYKLRLPVVGSILLRATLSRFARSFAMASRSGVPLLQALSVTARAVDNEFIARKVVGMREGIERGDSLTRTAIGMEVFTPLVIQMLSVGEETGRVDDMLHEVAEFYESEVEYDVGRLGELIQPVLVVGVGIVVFMLALGVFMPMWSLTQIAR